MTDSLQALMAGTEINNSFNIQSVSSTLKMTLENSFDYLYRLQRNMVRFKEYYFPQSISSKTKEIAFGDMYLDEKSRVCINIDIDLVKQTARDKFYNSDLYKQEFTLWDIQEHPEIFERSLVISVDRCYYFDITVKMMNGWIQIILPYKMDFLYRRNNAVVEHQTSVMVFDNSYFNQFSTHRGTLNAMRSDDNYYIGPSTVGIDKFRSDGTYMVSLQMDGDTGSSLLYPCTLEDNGMLRMDLNTRIADKIQDTATNILFTIIFFIDMHELVLDSGDAFMAQEVPGTGGDLSTNIGIIQREEMVTYNMPIPTENTFVFKQITDGSSYNGEFAPFYSSGTNLFYPNMYTVKDDSMEIGDTYRIFYFYKIGYDLAYTNRYLYFYEYLKNKIRTSLIENAVNYAFFQQIYNMNQTDLDALTGTFRKLMNYKGIDHHFDTLDFTKNYMKDITSYEYRVQRMKEFVADNTDVLKSYVRHQNTVADTYYLYTKGMDLSKRLRNDTSNELSYTITFDEPMYVFMFQNTEGSNYLNLRVWVDSLRCMGMVHEMEYGVDYIYIPQSMITDNSYIEIEVYHSCTFDGTIYFPDEETWCELVIPSDLVTPTMNDLMFYDELDPSIEYKLDQFEVARVRKGLDLSLVNNFGWVYNLNNVNAIDRLEGLSKEDPSITSMMDTLNLVPSDDEVVVTTDGQNVKYTTMDIIRIRAKDATILHKNINVKIRKNAYYQEFLYERTGYPIISLMDFSFKFDKGYIRVYKNGRLMPDTMYLVKDTFDILRLQMLFDVNPGDRLGIDISPLYNDLLYFVEEIPEDATFDLTGVIDKPFDIRYYDVFLNGKKLNETQVFAVSDTKIRLYNVDSIYHFEIYQKDRDEEYFGWTKNNITYYFRVEDLLAESFVTADDKEWIIDRIITDSIENAGKTELIDLRDNTNTEEKNCDDDIAFDEYLRHKIFYYEEILPLRLGDPNEVQFNKDYVASEYPEDYDVWWLEKTKDQVPVLMNGLLGAVRFPDDALYLDPDIHAEIATDVYMLGDYDHICEQLEKEEKGE